jgi:hypothetical protein
MISQPSNTLTEQASKKIEIAFPDSHTDIARVIWWDDGGYLKEIVEAAATELGVGFRSADDFPLNLREGAVEEERSADRPRVWYITEAKNDRDWFRDVRETGGEVTCSIEELTAELYEVNPWDIFDVERHDSSARDEAADLIKARFSPHSIPQYDALKEEIITKGGGQLLDHLLRGGWPEISRDPETVSNVRKRLRENHNVPVPEDATPEEITDTVRRWAVAQSLVDSGVDSDRFEGEFGQEGYSPLDDILEIRGARANADQYLGEEYWPSIIHDLDEVWEYATCPVDGALENALWESWYDSFVDGNLATCIERAKQRQEALSVYPEATAGVSLWNQTKHIARIEQYFTDWGDRNESRDPFEIYSDVDNGSWRIDNEVLQLQLTGTPESDLPSTHPATEALPKHRTALLEDRYKDYLDTLSEEVEATMQVGSPLVDKKPAYEWWSDHEDDFDELGTVAIFLIDALRFDLAQRLGERLSTEFDVKHETRIATLPSETKFGMAALTPGRSFRFDVSMDNGTLSVSQGDRSLSNKPRRVRFYEDEGWEVPDDPDTGWEHHHIAYYDKELDDVGEGEIGDIERHFTDYIEDLAGTIRRKLEDENWDRIYVVTDHGFVLLPEGSTMQSVSSPTSDTEVKYRRVAGDNLERLGSGVHLSPDTAGLDYLNTNLQVLVDPRQFFSKQGYDDSRFYHGGLLPQESMLCFLEIQS